MAVLTQMSFWLPSWHLVVPPVQSVTHCPPWQTLPDAHAVPQSPQCIGSRSRSTHTSIVSGSGLPPAPPAPPAPGFGTEHTVVPAKHVTLHAPSMQLSSTPHALSQAPQCASSFLRLKHEALSPTTHFVVPPLQSSSHAPTEHSWSAVHAVPHAPQCAPSTCVSTQRFLPSTSHLVVPPAHLSAQAPREHTSSASHALPHAPQLDGSKRTSRHAPSHSFSLAVQLDALPPLPVGAGILSRSVYTTSSQPAAATMMAAGNSQASPSRLCFCFIR